MSGAVRRLVITGLLALAFVVPAGAAGAQEDVARSLGLEATAGFDGSHAGSSWVPVTVTLEPERLFAGSISVTGRGELGEIDEERAVEVPGGGHQSFRFLLPSAHDVLVTARPDRGEAATVRAQVRALGSRDLLVGMLGDVPEGAPLGLETDPTGLDVHYASVDPAWLEMSPRAVHGVGTLVATTSALSDLTDAAKANLTNAVAGGLELVVTPDAAGVATELGDPGLPELPATSVADGSLAAAPDAWTLTMADLSAGATVDDQQGAVVAAARSEGRGRITVVATPLSAGDRAGDVELWSRVLAPGAHRQYDQGQQSALSRVMESAQQALSGNTLGLPSLPWLAGFLVVYVLVVGPVNGFALARIGRRELAWVTVPAITLLFAGGAFLAATASAPQTGLSGKLAYWIDGVGTDVSVTAVRAPTPGRHVVALDGGRWDVLPTSFRTAPTVRQDRSDTQVTFDLESLEVGVAVAWRPTATPAPLELEAVGNGAGIDVTVRNVGDRPLQDVHVRAATQRLRAGTLAPGESTQVSIPAERLRSVEPWVDEQEFAMGRRPDDGNLPQALEHLLRFQAMDRAPGLVWATASIPDGTGDRLSAVDGRSADDVGTLVAVAERVLIEGEIVPPHAVARTVVHVAGRGEGRAGWWPGPSAVEGADSVILRYRLPHVTDLRALTSTLDESSGGHAVEMDVPVPGAIPDCEPGTTCEEHHTECDPSGCTEVTRRVTCEDDGSCTVEEERCEPDGSCFGSITESLEVGVAEPPPPDAPPGPGQPPLPPDRPGPERMGGSVEVWDPSSGTWVPLEVVFEGEDTDSSRVVTPLGEVYVRVRGGGPFVEFSGRGIGAVLGGPG